MLVNPASASPNTVSTHAVAAAPAPLTQAQENWLGPDGINTQNWSYNPQTQINSSDAQYLSLNWIYPLPVKPAALSTLTSSGDGVGMAILIANGTAFATTLFDETIAFNVQNGDVLWTYIAPLSPNSTAGLSSGNLPLHSHDGNEAFTTATFGSGVSGPTLWYQGENYYEYAINALTGKPELNFSDFSGLAMVPGNNPGSIYNGIGASNLLINSKLGIMVTGHDAESDADNGRGFFARWNLNTSPPTLMGISYTVPPQPGSSVALDPNWDVQMINNMTNANTFYPGVGSPNGYTTPQEVAGGLLTPTASNPLVVDWKTMSSTQLNATLYNDWGQVGQSSQCLAITGGGSTGSTGSGWGGPWLLGSGQTAGLAFVTTNNKDPFTGPCNPGPDLWSASILALNLTTGAWVWAFQATAHDIWDYDCSWWQGMTNQTINGVNTEVIMKTCKNGYLYEINAVTGNLIWAWDPPASLMPRCSICYVPNPLNESWMTADFPMAMVDCAPTYTLACETGPQSSFLQYPSELAGFEDQQTYSPALNYIFAAAHIVPYFMSYIGLNSSTYFTSTGESGTPVNKGTCSDCVISNNNATIFAINAQTGQTVWHYFIADQGYRGGITNSGNMVFATVSSGDILMINAQTGLLTRDYYIGAPMDELATVGASTSGQENILIPVGSCGAGDIATCPGTTPGDVIALDLNIPSGTSLVSTTTVTSTTSGPGQTITTTVASTAISTVTSTATSVSTSSTGVSSTALYGVAAVAVIFIIATGYLAMRGKKPAS